MTNWSPQLARSGVPLYREIADTLARDIAEDRLPAGTRLPTHRDLAWRLRVTVGTVSRAYAETERRGLIGGEVGRGTYVRGPAQRDTGPFGGWLPLQEEFIDFTFNSPMTGEEAPALAAALARIS